MKMLLLSDKAENVAKRFWTGDNKHFYCHYLFPLVSFLKYGLNSSLQHSLQHYASSACMRSNVMTISQWFVSGNMSTGRAKVGLKGKEGYFFVGGAQSMAASRTNVPVGLQLT
jgi:hypothetical protein